MDICAEITNRIIAETEGGTIPWQKPWAGSGNAVSYAAGKSYSQLNQMLLEEPGKYLTFNKCRKADSYVRKEEKAKWSCFGLGWNERTETPIKKSGYAATNRRTRLHHHYHGSQQIEPQHPAVMRNHRQITNHEG